MLDQMLTGHSLLRDRYERRALALTLLVLGLSIVASSVAFLSGDATVSILGIKARVQVWVGVLTALIFFLTLVDLRVDWRQRAGAHNEAARRLSRLKGLFRVAAIRNGVVDSAGRDLNLEYDTTMDDLRPIPESRFVWIKAKHTRKVQASKLLDRHAGAPVWYVRLLAMWQGIRGIERPSTEDSAGASESEDEVG
ncbi:MAG TPA: hypothetical protein VF063_00670 [Gaiellaceae bacterium]